MKIIARKTKAYLNDEFFKFIINEDYVDGVVLDVLLNQENELLVYNYISPERYTVQQLQNTPISQIASSDILMLKDALKLIREARGDLLVYLNIIPNSITALDEEGLKKIKQRNDEYIFELDKKLVEFSDLDIKMHSINRTLALLLKRHFNNTDIGFVVYTLDLTPTDVDYYVFLTYMIDNTIFEELLNVDKKILIYIEDEADLAEVVRIYNSNQTTAQSSEILKKLSFITNQPILLNKIFSN